MQTIRLAVFPGGFNWPVWVAEELGYFAGQRLEVLVTPIAGSVEQFTGLIQGQQDLAITLFDNLIAYSEGQGEVLLTCEDLVALMASDTRVYPALVTAPHIKSYGDLRGQVLAVDAKLTGYAIVLYAMLEAGGLTPGDYIIESVGGVQQRYQALLEGRHAGALFNSPFEGLLVSKGYNLLETAAGVVGQYQGQVLATRRSWLRGNKAVVLGFMRALLSALSWIYEPANMTRALDIFVKRQPGASIDSARTAFEVLFNANTGMPINGALNLEGVRTAAKLRERFGVPRKQLLRSMENYLEPTYLEHALATLART